MNKLEQVVQLFYSTQQGISIRLQELRTNDGRKRHKKIAFQYFIQSNIPFLSYQTRQ